MSFVKKSLKTVRETPTIEWILIFASLILALLRGDKELSGGSSVFRLPRTEDQLLEGEAESAESAESDEPTDIVERGWAGLEPTAVVDGRETIGMSTLEVMLFTVPFKTVTSC